jgi:IQ calmodulin-binding motif
MISISKFVKDHPLLCICTLGIAILGYLQYHAVRWIINKCHKAEKIDRVAKNHIGVGAEIKPSPNNLIPKLAPLPSSPGRAPVDEIPLKQESAIQKNNLIPKHAPLPSSPGRAPVDEIPLKQESEIQKNFIATKIQNAYRGHVARLALKKLKAEKREKQKSAAALKIQSVWRGYSGRAKAEKAKKQLLSFALLGKSKSYIDTPSNLQDVPKASSGKTFVYLPKELPIVLKQSGSPANQERFDKMQQGRKICEENGYENLIIPKARVYRNFIIESRLPITEHDTKRQIGFYIENRDRFTKAVEEFTGFLCQSRFNDITGNGRDPYQTLSKTPLGRYDNIALYVEGDQGKIGLIDLEQFTPEYNRWCFFKCRDAVHLFPYHLDEIMSVAKRFDSNIEAHRGELERERDEALKGFKLIYEDHLSFIKEKKITFENPSVNIGVSFVKKEKIKEAMIGLIRKEHEDTWYKNCLGEQPEEVIALFGKSFPKILDLITDALSKVVMRKIERTKENISTYNQLLFCRTLCISRGSPFYNFLIKEVRSELQMMKLEEEWEKNGFASLIMNGVFEELAKEREIAYFNPRFDNDDLCIFC